MVSRIESIMHKGPIIQPLNLLLKLLNPLNNNPQHLRSLNFDPLFLNLLLGEFRCVLPKLHPNLIVQFLLPNCKQIFEYSPPLIHMLLTFFNDLIKDFLDCFGIGLFCYVVLE